MRAFKIFSITLAVVLVAAVAGLFGFAQMYGGKALPRTDVAGENMSGKTLAEIEQEVSSLASARTLDLSIAGKQVSVPLSEAGISVDATATAQEALAPSSTIWSRALGLLSSREIPAKFTVDEAAFASFVESLNAQTPSPTKEPQVIWAEDAFTTEEGATGTAVDVDQLTALAEEAAKSLTGDASAELTIVDREPAVSNDQALAAAGAANALVDVTIEVGDGIESYTAGREDAAKWIQFDAQNALAPTYNDAAIKAWVESIAEQTNEAPVPGIQNVDASGNVLINAREGKHGWKANNVDAIATGVIEAVKAGAEYSETFDYDKVEPGYEQREIAPGAENLPYPAAPGEKWIDINLTTAQMTCYEGTEIVRGPIPVVPGKPTTPTVDGHFNVYLQYESQTMRGLNDDGSRYVEPDVPWVSYFFESYSIHAAPWQRTFGWTGPGGSHGCVNTPTEDAKWIYYWAELGTSVMSHY
ncbi:MAG: L,D-transpeptidase family protein [Actinomycetaceae bacterium]|nr:L,D-transpeptidase family protein [Actinomycetaceae bacterium]